MRASCRAVSAPASMPPSTAAVLRAAGTPALRTLSLSELLTFLVAKDFASAIAALVPPTPANLLTPPEIKPKNVEGEVTTPSV